MYSIVQYSTIAHTFSWVVSSRKRLKLVLFLFLVSHFAPSHVGRKQLPPTLSLALTLDVVTRMSSPSSKLDPLPIIYQLSR